MWTIRIEWKSGMACPNSIYYQRIYIFEFVSLRADAELLIYSNLSAWNYKCCGEKVLFREKVPRLERVWKETMSIGCIFIQCSIHKCDLCEEMKAAQESEGEFAENAYNKCIRYIYWHPPFTYIISAWWKKEAMLIDRRDIALVMQSINIIDLIMYKWSILFIIDT